MSVQQLQHELDNLETQKQALEQDIHERPWGYVSLDPRETAWTQLQDKSILLRGKLRYALHKEHRERYLRQWLSDLDKRLAALKQEIRDYPWDPLLKEWLADYEEQRQIALADYALLQRETE